MQHPAISDLLAASTGSPVGAEVVAHLAECATCRRVVIGLGQPATQRTLVDLRTVDGALYHGRDPLPGGRGGMGLTMRAWDRRLGRDVVIKQIGEVADPVAREGLRARFVREARITARLAHPGIVGVLELGVWADGEPFYTMPLVSGEPFDRAISTRVSRAERLELLPRVLAAVETVAYAHDRGVVHRDIKPANILLGAFGETLVIDWGLAHELGGEVEPDDTRVASDGAPDLTILGIGTPAYMPPEQARGAAPAPTMDVYALGATLYHLLSGRPPYLGDAATARASLLAGPPPALPDVASDIPADLAAIVAKAMAREPRARFATALELAAELKRFLTGQLTRTYHYRPGERLTHWMRRNRTSVRVGLLALGLLVAGGVWSVTRIVRERDRAEHAFREAELGRQTAEQALAGSRAARASLLARSSPTSRLDALELVASAAGDLQAGVTPDIVQGVADVLAAGPIAVAVATPGPPVAVAFSPDSALAVTVDGDQRVRAWDGHDGRARGSLAMPFAPLWARFVDDHRVAIWGLDPRVIVWTIGGDARELTTGGEPWALVASDGPGMVTAGGRGELRAWSAAGQRLAETNVGCRPAVLAARAGLVAIACARGVIAWDPATGRSARIVDGRAASQLTIDEATLCTVLDQREIACIAMDDVRTALTGETLALRRVFGDPAGTVYRIDLTPDGRALAFGTGVQRTLELATLELRELGHELEAVPPRGPRWAGFSTVGPTVAVLDTTARDVVLHLRGHQTFERAALATRPDGARVLAATAAGETWLWDTRIGAKTGVLPELDVEIVGIAVDGERVHLIGLDGRTTVVQLDGMQHRRGRARSDVLAWDGQGGLAGTRTGEVHRIGGDGLAAALVHGSAVSALATSPDRASAVSGGLDGSLVVWDLRAGREQRRVAAGGEAVSALAHLGDRIVVARRDGSVEVVDTDGTARGAVTLASTGIRALVLGPDQVAIATETGDGVLLRLDGAALAPPESLAGAPLEVGPDGELALTSTAGMLRLRTRSGVTTDVAQLPRTPAHAVFAPDGTTVWTGDVTGSVRGFDLQARRAILTFAPEGLGAVTSLAMSADARWLVVGYGRGAVRVFPATRAAMRERLCVTLRAHRRPAPRACDGVLTDISSTTSSR